MRCGDCKHWKQVEEEVDPDGDSYETKLAEFGLCRRVQGEALQHYSTCDGSTTMRGSWRATVGDRDAVPCDGSGYHAALLTRDRFGCVLFEVSTPDGSADSR